MAMQNQQSKGGFPAFVGAALCVYLVLAFCTHKPDTYAAPTPQYMVSEQPGLDGGVLRCEGIDGEMKCHEHHDRQR